MKRLVKASKHNAKMKIFHISDLKPVIGPAAELHNTSLFVEWEILDVNLTGGFINGGRFPLYQPIIP